MNTLTLKIKSPDPVEKDLIGKHILEEIMKNRARLVSQLWKCIDSNI